MCIKVKCNIIFSVVLFLFLQESFSQAITVLEAGNNEPIPDVAIYNLKKTKYVVTDINGRVKLDIFTDRETIFFQNLLYEKLQLRKAEIDKNTNVIYLALKIESLKQIVISASKFEQSKRDIPQTIVSINSKEIALANPQTSADLLENTGNIYVQKSQLGGGSPLIRGFSTNRLIQYPEPGSKTGTDIVLCA